ncbi:unnamed protein product [Prorocentrum cordatum]|uniref:Uncharacterized protein n=1 Tax=Prorocentrum cordatum TaxID=2364126 RepID=A0ABN9TH37_9DINO|nr:unnamed protein product [Polarella glacialis]
MPSPTESSSWLSACGRLSPSQRARSLVQYTAASVVLDGVGATGAAEAARGPRSESAGRRPAVHSSTKGRGQHPKGDQRGEPAHLFAERLRAMSWQRADLPVIEPAPEVDLGVNLHRRPQCPADPSLPARRKVATVSEVQFGSVQTLDATHLQHGNFHRK